MRISHSKQFDPPQTLGVTLLTMWLAVIWTIWCAWCQVSGWVLSLLGQLGRGGYVTAFILFLALVLYLHRNWKIRLRLGRVQSGEPFRWRRRLTWKRIPQLLFWSICALSLLGAIFNTPWGYDSYSYRVARIVRWLQEGQYHWTGAADQRIDVCSLASDWQLLSILAITGSDRLLFLVNFVPYIIFPGMFYMAARGLHIRRQWALLGMWLVPLGYCFSLTSGGIQNDGVAGIHVIAAIAFLKSRSTRILPRLASLYLCLISIALISGLKLSNLPIAFLLLVWCLWSSRAELNLMLRRPLATLFIAAVCLSCSTLPTAIQNFRHEGNLSGDPQNRFRCEGKNLIAAPLANLAFLVPDMLAPNPFAGKMNVYLNKLKDNSEVFKWVAERHFMLKRLSFQSIAHEMISGPGFPVLVGLPLLFLTARLSKLRKFRIDDGLLLLIVSVVAYSVYLVKMGSDATVRISACYYPPMILGIFNLISQLGYIPRVWSGRAIFLISAMAVQFNIIFSLSRPLLPDVVKDKLESAFKGNPYQLHRYCAEQVGQVGKLTDHRIYFVLELGGMSHQLYSPYRPGGGAVEVGSCDWNSNRPSGPGYLAISTLGIQRRYGLTVEDFVAKLGDAIEIGRDRDDIPQAQDIMLRLYHVADLSLIPDPPTQRMYVYGPE